MTAASLRMLLAACGSPGAPGAPPAACHDGLPTGFQKEWNVWVYYHRPHVGATCSYLFAELGWNPYWGQPVAIARR